MDGWAGGSPQTGGYAKKKTFRATQQDSPHVRQRRADYLDTIEELNPKTLVYIDETGCQLEMPKVYARCLPGQRAHDTRPYRRGNQISIVGALGYDSVRTAMAVEGTIDGPGFLTFVERCLVPTLIPGEVVVMDNLGVHGVTGVEQAIRWAGARVLFLPPYSPELNPIEECWSKVKEFLRNHASGTLRHFLRNLKGALESVSPYDVEGWFEHAHAQAH